MLRTALPARSSPSGSSIAAVTARVSVFAVSARAPSIAAIGDDRGQREVIGEQGQDAERRRLGGVDRRQDEAGRRALEAGDEERRHQRRQEAGPDEEQRRRQGAVGELEDEHREGDDAEPVAHLVDRVGDRQAAECRPSQGVAQAWITHFYVKVLRRLCTSFLADAQVFAKLWYKLASRSKTFLAATCARGK